MVHPEDCPLDGSALLSLAGMSSDSDGYDIFVNYCPRCDVAFAFLAPLGAGTPTAVFQWHRRGGRLELLEGQERWQALPRQFREDWESTIRTQVERFLDSRHSEAHCCPLDGGTVPILHRWRDEMGKDWLLTWCKWCGMGFLHSSDRDYGWQCSATVTWDGRRYHSDGHAMSPELMAELPPPPSPVA